MSYSLSHLQYLESESIYIMREVVAEFKNPVMLYSVGKDSSVMMRLAQKAFFPAKVPFPLMHIDTGYKFPEMYEFRDAYVKENGARLIIERNEEWIEKGAHPSRFGVDKCCAYLKTQGLLHAIQKHGFDAAFGGSRREEEKSRAKERVFSVRDQFGQWDPKNQRPELWNLYNSRINEGESVRVFPLSNWTELDIWMYIKEEKIPVVPLYFAKKRKVIARKGILIPVQDSGVRSQEAEDWSQELGARGQDNTQRAVRDYQSAVNIPESPVSIKCRFRSLGCIPCTGAVQSEATTLDEIISEVAAAKKSERENRIIDLTGDSSMEQKKREGYF